VSGFFSGTGDCQKLPLLWERAGERFSDEEK
jgi:hypothetical protein